jgi:hypothetical protein
MSGIYSHCQALIIWLGKASGPAAQLFWQNRRREVLLQNSYFTRVWIVQEVLLAKHIKVLGGTTWIDWSAFTVIPLTCSLVTAGVPIATLSLLDRAQSYVRGSTSLAALLLNFYDNNCTDPRDYVYGLLGLVSKDQRPEIDYTKTLWEVFLDTALTLCNAGHNRLITCRMALPRICRTWTS